MFEKCLKKIEKTLIFFWKFAFFWRFFWFFFGKTALNRGLALFSRVSKLHYTGDRTNWNRTNRGLPVLICYFSLRFFLFYFFRFGHSLVSSLIQFYKDFKSSPDSFIEEPFDDHFFNVTMVLKIPGNVLPLSLPSERQRPEQNIAGYKYF